MTWEELAELVGQNVHVIGLASTEGAAMVDFLWSSGVTGLTVHDFQAPSEVQSTFGRTHVGLPKPERGQLWNRLASLPIERRFGTQYLKGVAEADAVFVGQAWQLYPPNLPRLVALRDAGVPFHTITELYCDLSPAPILAVTGSNGKSTTCRLAEAIVGATLPEVSFAGNERRSVQVLPRLRELDPEGLLILEISNRQLMDVRPRPRIGVITTILPNHLNEHDGDFGTYVAVKSRLLAYQSAEDFAVLNADDPVCRGLIEELPGRVYLFSATDAVERGAWLKGERICMRHGRAEPVTDAGSIAESRLPGEHNQYNVLAASLAAWLAGAPPEAVEPAVSSFAGLRHRIQFVWRAAGVDYYDDLNATSPQATAAAVRALPSPLILISGGDDKGLDFCELADVVCRGVKRLYLLPGTGSERLAESIGEACPGGSEPSVTRFEMLEQAVAAAVEEAEPGDTVLLSPACPGFFSRHYLGAGTGKRGFKALLRRHAIENE